MSSTRFLLSTRFPLRMAPPLTQTVPSSFPVRTDG